jgi:hypothetical protein
MHLRSLCYVPVVGLLALGACDGGGGENGLPANEPPDGSDASAPSDDGGMASSDAGSDLRPGPVDCDVDRDGERSLACRGRDCDDLSAEISTKVKTDLNLADNPAPENEKREVLELHPDGGSGFYVLYRLGEAQLRLAHWQESGWTVESVSALPVRYSDSAAMVLDSAGHIHVALVAEVPETSPTIRELHYTTNASGAWVETQLTFTSATHFSRPAIAVDADGAVHIVARGEELLHFSETSGSFTSSVVSATSSRGILAADGDGNLRLVYTTGFGFKFGTIDGDTFTEQGEVERGGSGDLAALVDGSGVLHVAAVGVPATGSGKLLKYTLIDGAVATDVDVSVAYPARPHFAVGSSGDVHLFSDIKISTGHLVGLAHVFRDGGAFKTRTLYSTPSYRQTPFGFAAIDPQNRLHRFTPEMGTHQYSDDVDNDCDGDLWSSATDE